MAAQLPDDELEHLFSEIERLGEIYAKAAAKQKQTEEARKIGKSALMKMARAMGHASSRDSAEAWAYTHPQYKELSDAMVAAIEAEITAKIAAENAVRRWESWRTLCANERSITRT